MKKLIFIILIPIFAFSNTIFPKEVAYVNIEKFTGLWYEIARTYNSFEEGCIAPTVEYTKTKADELKVQNRCFTDKIGGNLKSYEGLVKPLNKNSLSTLNKTYFWIFSKDYKIIYLDDYQTAIMSDEKLENLWIISREPELKEEKLKEVLTILDKYIDTKKLIFPKQDKKGKYK